MSDFTFIAILIVIFIGSRLYYKYWNDDSVAVAVHKPFRKLANGQKFEKAYMHDGDFTAHGFEATFILVFSKEHISVDVRGFTTQLENGVSVPQITDSWCETYERELTTDEIDMVFGYVDLHDSDFHDQLKICVPRNA